MMAKEMCLFCGQPFDDALTLKQHLQSVHADNLSSNISTILDQASGETGEDRQQRWQSEQEQAQREFDALPSYRMMRLGDFDQHPKSVSVIPETIQVFLVSSLIRSEEPQWKGRKKVSQRVRSLQRAFGGYVVNDDFLSGIVGDTDVAVYP